MSRSNRYSPEVRERAVRLVREAEQEHNSQWAAIQSISAKIGCTHETLRRWVRQSEKDHGERAGLTTDEKALLKQLKRENRGLKQANEILRKAQAFFGLSCRLDTAFIVVLRQVHPGADRVSCQLAGRGRGQALHDLLLVRNS